MITRPSEPEKANDALAIAAKRRERHSIRARRGHRRARLSAVARYWKLTAKPTYARRPSTS
jgi:hypothetical protein